MVRTQRLGRAWKLRSSGQFFLVCGLSCLAAGTFSVTSPETAFAQEAGQEPMRVLVGKLSGAKPTSARNWIVEGLQAEERFEVLPNGESLKIGASQSEIASAAAAQEADAVILGKSVFGWSAELSIYDGKDGSLIEAVEVPRGSWEEYESQLVGGSAYFSVIDRAEGFPPPAPVAEEPVLEEEAPAEELPPEEKGQGRPSPLDVSVGVRLYSRSFRYTDTLEQLGGTDAPPDYNLPFGPMPGLNLHWYPAAHFTGGWVAHLGLTGGYERGVGTQVSYVDPMTGTESTFGQTHQLWYAGLRGRIPIKIFTLGLGVNFGQHTFKLNQGDAAVDPTTLYPELNYTYLEMGGDGELQVGKVKFGAQGAFVLPLSLGGITDDAWYPEASAIGVHFGGHVAYAFIPALDLMLGIDGRVYGLDFNPLDPSTPDIKVAGGAKDSYISAWLALRVILPGKAGAESDSASSSESESDDFDSFDSFD